MAINLSVIPYQLEYDGKIYFVHNRGVDGSETYIGYRTKNGEGLIIQSKTDESETLYYKTTSANYDTDWTNKSTLGYGVI